MAYKVVQGVVTEDTPVPPEESDEESSTTRHTPVVLLPSPPLERGPAPSVCALTSPRWKIIKHPATNDFKIGAYVRRRVVRMGESADEIGQINSLAYNFGFTKSLSDVWVRWPSNAITQIYKPSQLDIVTLS